MKILMIAPEPIFEPRGTPMSVVGRMKALSEMGHHIDLLTYSIGEDVSIRNVHIHRIPRLPGIRKVRIGPSFKKIPLDLFLIFKTFVFLVKNEYDLIHTHEEAGFWGTAFAQLFRIPHLYDMHSSLPQQLGNFQFSKSKVLLRIFEALEAWVLRHAASVITICPDLQDYVRKSFPEKGSFLIENVVDYGMIFGEVDSSDEIQRQYALDDRRVVLYTGTFEPYQGLDLLIDSAEIVAAHDTSAVFLMVGGHPDQVAHYQNRVETHGLQERFIFTGQVKPQEVNSYINCADVLVSPRISGTNTPLKLYAYLRSGVPIVATRLWTHTQVLNEDVAALTDPTAPAFADGIISVLKKRQLAKMMQRRANELADRQYSYSVYLEKLDLTLRYAVGEDV